MILGISSGYDESLVGVINSYGDIIANEKHSQFTSEWKANNGGEPRVIREFNEENLPKLVEKTIKEANITKGDSRFKAITVALGPGLETSLNIGIELA